MFVVVFCFLLGGLCFGVCVCCCCCVVVLCDCYRVCLVGVVGLVLYVSFGFVLF